MNNKSLVLIFAFLGACMSLATAQVEEPDESEIQFIDLSVEPEDVATRRLSRKRLRTHWNIRKAMADPLAYYKLSLDNPKEELYLYLDSLYLFEKLDTLSIVRKKMDRFTTSIAKLKLKKVSLSYNDFDQIPAVIYQIPSLQFLEMKSNQVDSITAEIGNLEQLVELSMYNNKIHHLDSEIAKCQQLEKLDLRDNYIGRLPDALGQLKKLKHLYLANNALVDFPPPNLRLDAVEQLILGGSISYRAWDTLRLENGQVLARSDSMHLTDDIVQLPRLEYLRIMACEKAKLSEKLFDLPSLKTIVLYYVDTGNAFFERMLRASQLEKIEMSGYIDSIPSDLSQMQNLKHLELSSTKIRHLPSSLYELKQLKQLLLPGCRVQEVSEEIVQLRNLEKLDLKKNKLRKLPENIGEMKSLRRLQLRDNQLTELPASITQLKELIYIDISGNPMTKEYILALKQMLPNTNVFVGKWPD